MHLPYTADGQMKMEEGRWKREAKDKRNNRGRRIRGFPAPSGAQIQSGHFEHLLPVLKTEGIAQGADHLGRNVRTKAGPFMAEWQEAEFL